MKDCCSSQPAPREEPAAASCCRSHDHADTVIPRAAAAFFCPMCPGVESDKPGDCPKCGMSLEPNPAFTGSTIYTCPMHPEIEQDHPGDCPICGMALEPKTIAPTADEHAQREIRELSRKFWIGTALTLPVILLVMWPMFTGTDLVPRHIGKWIEFVLTTPVIVWAGGIFFVRGWRSLKGWNLNMFTLVALGVGAAYLYSVVAVLVPRLFPASFRHHGEVGLYFEAAAVITVLVLLGQLLEARARSRTGQAIQALLGMAAKTAPRLLPGGGEEQVPVEHLRKGDRLRVRPGEKVPLDGVIEEGRSHIDESMISGEPVPVKRGAGDIVIGATINQSGSFVMSVTRVGAETLLAQIVEMVARAQRSRTPIQKVVDEVSRWFVPAVLAVAVLTFIVWSLLGPEPALALALVNAVSVLIIACPCALGLATPMSIMVGVGRAAREGILVKDAEAIETTEKIDTLVTDKTGTLTAGRPEVTGFTPAPEIDSELVLRAAAALESHSEHPLARAVSAYGASGELLEVSEFESTTGGGVSGTIGPDAWHAGKRAFIEGKGAAIPASLAGAAEEYERDARTLVWLARNGEAVGLFAISDPIKPSTPEAIAALHRLGIRLVMATGDSEATARAIAGTLGIDEVHAALSPEDKIRLIKRLKNEGRRVAMTGDGINDAPALAEANVGIAMGTGTDVAIESAHLTLVKGDLNGVARAIAASKAVMRNIRQNLFFAFIYNGIGIPVAAGILYPFTGILLSPMIAGAAMALSSVSVITNALRLRKAPLDL